MTTMNSGALGANVLELDGMAIGIVLPEGARRVRFYTGEAAFRRLDGRLFRGTREVLAAAREAVRPYRATPGAPPSPDPSPAIERTADLVPAMPGSVLQAL